jgi:hypothetical protein
MKLTDMLPQLDADALATVRINALRLVEHGNPKQKREASEALPLIEAEQTRRADAAPPKVAKSRAKAKKPTAKAAKDAEKELEVPEAVEADSDHEAVEAGADSQLSETGNLH